MSEYKFSERAYAKIIFHAAKYPYLAVNGVLLAQKSSSAQVQIVDAIPLFHQCLFVTPMAEIALMQIDAFAEKQDCVVAGYYAAAENFYENSIEKAPAAKIADKIQENYRNACFVVVDNKLICSPQKQPAVKVFSYSGDGGPRWLEAPFSLESCEKTLEAISALLERGAMQEVVDFDNHLDNPQNDWTNEFLNRDLHQILTMY